MSQGLPFYLPVGRSHDELGILVFLTSYLLVLRLPSVGSFYKDLDSVKKLDHESLTSSFQGSSLLEGYRIVYLCYY